MKSFVYNNHSHQRGDVLDRANSPQNILSISNRLILCFLLTFTTVAYGQFEFRNNSSMGKLLQDGFTLYQKGEYAKALIKFQVILNSNSTRQVRNGNTVTTDASFASMGQYNHISKAQEYAFKCREALKQGDSGNSLKRAQSDPTVENSFRSVIIPSVQLDDLAIDQALREVTAKAKEVTGGRVVPNFVFTGTKEQRTNIRITLKTKDVQLNMLVRQIANLGRCGVSFDTFAVVLTPTSKGNLRP